MTDRIGDDTPASEELHAQVYELLAEAASRLALAEDEPELEAAA